MLLLNSNALKENAKDFISLSCEEFQTNDGKKIKAAICNIYRGLLLLLKAYILQKTENLYDDLFIYEAKIYGLDGESQLTLSYKSDKTLNRKSIFETIKKLKILPQEDVCRLVGLKEDLDIIARKRNELEHAHIDHPETQLRYVFFMAYRILKDLLEIFRQDINEFLGSDCEEIEKKYQDYEKMKNKKRENFRNGARHLNCVNSGFFISAAYAA